MASNIDLFDEYWYLTRNQDVAEAVAQGLFTAREHFEHHGKYEGRSPAHCLIRPRTWIGTPM
jgi:hypothetical protein